VLDDGRYDAMVIDAEVRVDQHVDRDATSIACTLTIVSGAHKGVVVDVVTSNIAAIAGLSNPSSTSNRAAFDPVELLGLPCTLVVENGVPRLEP
jgi:hypothetical protein